MPISAKTMTRRYPSYLQDFIRDLIDAQNADQSGTPRNTDKHRGKPSDSVSDGLFRVIMSGAGPATGRAIRRYRGFMSPNNMPPQPHGDSVYAKSDRFSMDDPNDSHAEAANTQPIIDLYARFHALNRLYTDMQDELDELRAEIVRVMDNIQEPTDDSETVAPTHPAASANQQDIIRTVQMGIIPANVTEQAWPMLLDNLQKAGVPIPEVDTWITDETYGQLRSLFYAHCDMLHVDPRNA